MDGEEFLAIATSGQHDTIRNRAQVHRRTGSTFRLIPSAAKDDTERKGCVEIDQCSYFTVNAFTTQDTSRQVLSDRSFFCMNGLHRAGVKLRCRRMA